MTLGADGRGEDAGGRSLPVTDLLEGAAQAIARRAPSLPLVLCIPEGELARYTLPDAHHLRQALASLAAEGAGLGGVMPLEATLARSKYGDPLLKLSPEPSPSTVAGLRRDGGASERIARAAIEMPLVPLPGPPANLPRIEGLSVIVSDQHGATAELLARQVAAWGAFAESAAADRLDAALARCAATAAGNEPAPIALVSANARACYEAVGRHCLLAFCRELGLRLVTYGGGGAPTDIAWPLTPARLAAALAPRRAAAPRRVLVVDDSGSNRAVVRLLLEGAGYRVDEAGDGHAAIAAVAGATYDAVLMDISMPNLDGFEATAAIRAHGGAGTPPVLALTATALPGFDRICREAGMAGYVTKPVGRAALLAAVDRSIGDGMSAANADPAPSIDRGVLDDLARHAPGDRLAALFAGFRAETETRVGGLAAMADGGDMAALHRAAHALKSAAGTFGARELYAGAAELERCGNDRARAAVLVRQLAAIAPRELAALAEAVASAGKSGG
jgi:CheY-like chemotaxis protein